METFEEPGFTCLACAWALGFKMSSPSNIVSDAFDIMQQKENTKTVSSMPNWHYYNVLPHVCVNGASTVDAPQASTVDIESSAEEFYTFGSEYYSFEISTTITGDVLVPGGLRRHQSRTSVGPVLSQYPIMQFAVDISQPDVQLQSPSPRDYPSLVSTPDAVQLSPVQSHPDPPVAVDLYQCWSAYNANPESTHPMEDASQCAVELRGLIPSASPRTPAFEDGPGPCDGNSPDSTEKSHDHPVSLLRNRSIPLPTNWDQEEFEKNSQSNDTYEVEDKRHPNHALPRRTYNLRNLPSRSQSRHTYNLRNLPSRPQSNGKLKHSQRTDLTKVKRHSRANLEKMTVAGIFSHRLAADTCLRTSELDEWTSLLIDVSNHVPRSLSASGQDALSVLLDNVVVAQLSNPQEAGRKQKRDKQVTLMDTSDIAVELCNFMASPSALLRTLFPARSGIDTSHPGLPVRPNPQRSSALLIFIRQLNPVAPLNSKCLKNKSPKDIRWSP
ncbi:hypothetical protein VFPPC_11573 [Pochonia chlamydosporia 170]|uniref:Uncharacterized protein n=1 Tax=Pochonia chlamydosporia 170 TaxID=1380566 RepID=A0A179EZ22_METCM|nr:hypothetical protein VFPPC_11573 [Pochonia chlamydosporia 170]OAQ58444.1 hypothetical protein VFPPC_11573 [Pochonia chlamydosporia 170]